MGNYEGFIDMDPKRVSEGMMRAVESLDMSNLSNGEKSAVFFFITKALYDEYFCDKISLSEIFSAYYKGIEKDCKEKKVPEFGAAINYVKKELRGINDY